MGEFENWLNKSEVDAYTNPYDAARIAWSHQQSKIEQLEKRISDALKVLSDASPTMLDKKAIRILRGECG